MAAKSHLVLNSCSAIDNSANYGGFIAFYSTSGTSQCDVTIRNIEASVLGDLDCDCEITAFDAYLALKYSIEDELEQTTIRVADVDEDSVVTAFDAYMLHACDHRFALYKSGA